MGEWANDVITLSIALLGAVLGVMNTWNAMNDRRLRIRVTPAHAVMAHGELNFSIEAVNFSAFAITLEEAGFIVGNSRGRSPKRIVIPNPTLVDGRSIPVRLAPRESVSFYFDVREIIATGEPIGKAYIRTACGVIVRGNSQALEQVRRGEAPWLRR